MNIVWHARVCVLFEMTAMSACSGCLRRGRVSTHTHTTDTQTHTRLCFVTLDQHLHHAPAAAAAAAVSHLPIITRCTTYVHKAS